MIELARLATMLKDFVEAVPVPVVMVLVPGLIIVLAIVATAVATFIEEQLPPEEMGH